MGAPRIRNATYVLARLTWHFDISAARGGQDVEWIIPKSYAMMEKQPFDVQLKLANRKILWAEDSQTRNELSSTSTIFGPLGMYLKVSELRILSFSNHIATTEIHQFSISLAEVQC